MTTKIPHYLTERGLLVSLSVDRQERHRINDKPLTATFHPQWWIVEGESELISYSVHAGTKAINERYVLVNDAVEGIQKVIPREAIERDSDGAWTGIHKGLDSLYRYERDQQDLGYAPQAFEPQMLGTLSFQNLGDPTRFSYKTSGERYDEKGPAVDYASLFTDYSWLPRVNVDEIVKAMTPTVAWHLHPCSVTSVTAYRIIRAHVKDNINPLYAEITSDYDFCFTVKKKIRIVPYIKKTEQFKYNGKSYRPPHFKSRTVDYESHEVFEMTQDKERYRGYTVVEGFKGESLLDLAKNIDTYLAALMEVINAPLTQCPKCHGKAVTDYFKLSTNERKQFGIPA